jgi:hypothetical protein
LAAAVVEHAAYMTLPYELPKQKICTILLTKRAAVLFDRDAAPL